MSSHDEIQKAYGSQALQSAPVDLENPSFASLLSAFQAVHSGQLPAEALRTYYTALSREVEESRRSVRETTSGHPLELTLTTLDLSQTALEAIPEYLATPSPQALAECVQRFMIAQNAMAQLNWYLDQHTSE